MSELAVPDLRRRAEEVAEALMRAVETSPSGDARQGESNVLNRPIDTELRRRFIGLRTELVRRGIFDPLLGRFDSYTAPQAGTREVAEELKKLSEALQA